MAYSTPSPSDSNWSSSFSDCETSVTSSSWSPHDLNIPVTPPMPFATISDLQRCSVTSAPQACTMSPSSSPISTASSASAPTGRGRRYAKDNDWTRHRETITTLYIGQNKTLKDVMATMEHQHEFVATERMYKARFKEWSVGKNVTAAAVHKLIAKVEQHQKSGPLLDRDCESTELDLGDDLDVKRIQKYMKRKPVGLKKLRADPKRPLDVIKALSVDNGKGRLGRAKVSLPTVELDYQKTQPPFQMMSPPSDLMTPWSPRDTGLVEDGLPDEMTHLIQSVVDQEFNMAYSFANSSLPLSPTAPPPWQSMHSDHGHLMASAIPPVLDSFQSPDQLMLDFVLKFRIAHILLDDGLTVQAFEVVNMCLNILSTRLQQAQGSDSRASGTVILYALTAALEMATCFNQLDVLHMLFQHIDIVCSGQQPRMAEIARRMPQLGRIQQISMLKLARLMMSRAAMGYSGHENPGYEVYSRTVDIAIGHESSDEKLRALQAYLADPSVQSSPYMAVWMEGRISLAVCDAPLANQHQGFWQGQIPIAECFPVWTQGDKITAVLKYSSDRIDWHKVTGNWATAGMWANDLAWLAEMVRGYNDEMSRRFRADIDNVKSPMLGGQPTHADVESDTEVTAVSGPMVVSLPHMHTLQASMSLPEMRGFKQDMSHPVSSAGWGHHAHVPFHDTSLPSLWDATGGMVDGLHGVSLYDHSSSF